MTTRRAFMQIAAAAVAPGALGVRPAAAHGSAPHWVLFEESMAPARLFAQSMASRGIATLALREGDLTRAWLHTLRPGWQRGDTCLAGLTLPASLFCLEQLAFEHGRRVIFHAEHVLLPGERVTHQLHRTAFPLEGAALDQAGARWPLRLAGELSTPRAAPGPRPGPSLAALEPALPPGARLLASWIIA